MSAPMALPVDESLVLKKAQALIVQKSVGTGSEKANCKERSGHGQELKICSRLRGIGLARSIPQPSYNHWVVPPRLTLFLEPRS